MQVGPLSIGWPEIATGLMVVGGFVIGVWVGRNTSDRKKQEWPTPYPREKE